jgi:hypothetical protein
VWGWPEFLGLRRSCHPQVVKSGQHVPKEKLMDRRRLGRESHAVVTDLLYQLSY